MKANEFKSFLHIIEVADKNNPIWCAGFAFMRLTPRQHDKVWDVLNKRGFEHETIRNHFGAFDGVKLPTGLVLLKGGNGERW